MSKIGTKDIKEMSCATLTSIEAYVIFAPPFYSEAVLQVCFSKDVHFFLCNRTYFSIELSSSDSVTLSSLSIVDYSRKI